MEALATFAAALAEGIDEAIGPWVIGSVRTVYAAQLGVAPPADVLADADRAATAATAEISPKIRELLAKDIDEQRTGPLAILRSAVRFPTEVLVAAGVPSKQRDEFARNQFPDDVYDLNLAAFVDLAPDLHETGLIWGAAKAHVHLSRRRAEGRS
ncbi:hypothetical protein MCETE7_02101 [Acidimicrobiia bacterium]